MATEKITIVTSPHERPVNQSIKRAPTTEQEFYEIVNNSKWPVLKEYGFRKWDTMTNVVEENIKHKDDPKIISIPTYNLDQAAEAIAGAIEGTLVQPSGSMLYDLGCKEEVPMEFPTEELDIILFPGEWYNLIPNGFSVVGLSGEKYSFEKGKSDNDIRFGCLAYGITRKSETKK